MGVHTNKMPRTYISSAVAVLCRLGSGLPFLHRNHWFSNYRQVCPEKHALTCPAGVNSHLGQAAHRLRSRPMNAFVSCQTYFVDRNSRLANIFLMLHGMNIDLASKVDLACFRPSQLDLIKVRKSFITKCTFDLKYNDQFRVSDPQMVVNESHAFARSVAANRSTPSDMTYRESISKTAALAMAVTLAQEF